MADCRREFTAGIVGTGAEAEVVGVMEVILNPKAEADAYSYLNKEECEDRVVYQLVKGGIERECRDVTQKAWRGLGARGAGRVDLRVSRDGKVSFIEVNPLAGLHPQHSDLPIICSLVGITFPQLIERILASAMRREGHDVIDLSAGRAAEHTPAYVCETAVAALMAGDTHQPLARGTLAYRDACAAKLHRENGLTVDPAHEVLATMGVKALQSGP